MKTKNLVTTILATAAIALALACTITSSPNPDWAETPVVAPTPTRPTTEPSGASSEPTRTPAATPTRAPVTEIPKLTATAPPTKAPEAVDQGRTGARQPAESKAPDAVANAAEAAARHLGVEQDDLTLLDWSPVTWPNGAMGCPKPGMMYTQALVPGFIVRFQHGEETVTVHAAEGGNPAFVPVDCGTG